jgi:hypothetical protein
MSSIGWIPLLFLLAYLRAPVVLASVSRPRQTVAASFFKTIPFWRVRLIVGLSFGQRMNGDVTKALKMPFGMVKSSPDN